MKSTAKKGDSEPRNFLPTSVSFRMNKLEPEKYDVFTLDSFKVLGFLGSGTQKILTTRIICLGAPCKKERNKRRVRIEADQQEVYIRQSYDRVIEERSRLHAQSHKEGMRIHSKAGRSF